MMHTILPAADGAAQAPEGMRFVPALLCGAPIAVPCPAWCVTDHASENLKFIQDLSHEGAETFLPVPVYAGPDEKVLRARLCWWPFAGAPYMALDGAGDGECAELQAAGALAFADQLVAHAAEIRRQARTLQGEA